MILNTIPLIGASWGLLFVLFLIANKHIHTNNPTAKKILIGIFLLKIHTLIDAYFNYNGFHDAWWSGFSYLHYQLMGYFILWYTSSLLKLPKVSRVLTISIIAYSCIRSVVLVDYFIKHQTLESAVNEGVLLLIDFHFALLVNIIPLVRLFFKVQKLNFSVELNAKNEQEFKWLKYLIVISILIYAAIFITSTISLFYESAWFLYMKLNSMLTSFFFFVFAYVAIKFPVFAIHGDYNELLDTNTPVKKYASSNLKEQDSDVLWNKIETIMKEEKPYLNPEFRLNDLANKTDKKLHHVSQVINEKTDMNFFDFVNRHRINDAKELLGSDKAKKFTNLAIAFEVGFNSKTTFYTAFKKETGTTPTQYKKSLSE